MSSSAATQSEAKRPGDISPVVFVVDDDISVRESLASLIGFAGWRTETFESAREFLDRPQEFAASCLVLDVHLPDLSGMDVQQRIKAPARPADAMPRGLARVRGSRAPIAGDQRE